MRQVLIYSKCEKPRQALAGEIRALNIADEAVETASFDEFVSLADREFFSVLIADEPTDDQMLLLASIRKGCPVFCLTAVKGAAKIEDVLVFEKPFHLPVFFTALIAAGTRFEQSDGAAIAFGEWKFNNTGKVLTRGNDEIRLTEKEASLISLLSGRGGYVDRETILRDVWGYADGITTHTLETHIYRLRQKLEGSGLGFESGEDGYKFTF